MTKEHLHNYVDLMTDQQVDRLTNVVNALYGYDINDLCKALNIDTSNMDFAKPIEWVRNLEKDYGIKSMGFVWDYNTNKFGAPLNIHTVILEKLFDIFHKETVI